MKMIASAAVFVIMSIFFVVSTENPQFEQIDDTGIVIIQVIDANGEIIIEDELEFISDETLFSLLKKHYSIQYSNVSLGRILLGIETVQTDFETDFIQILITGTLHLQDGSIREFHKTPSPIGIDSIPLVDGNIYTFKHQRIGQ